MNLKNERILKLHRKGLTPEQIARKLGLPNTERVIAGLNWLAEEKRTDGLRNVAVIAD